MSSNFTLPFDLPENWHLITVEHLVKEKIIEKPLDGNHGGIHPKSSDYVDEGVPFVMASNLENGRVNLKDCKFITEEQAKTLRKGFAKTGDVLISHKATIGRTAIVQVCDHDFIMLTPQVTYYRVKDAKKLNNRYLKFYFDSRFFQQILAQWAGAGSTRAYLGITGQLKLPVIVPPLEIQKEIASSIGALDDKIELNRQINQTLEQIAQAIFKSWFVNFEPVKAKIQAKQNGQDPERAAMRTISGKTDEQLDQLSPEQHQQLTTTAAHFPDELVDSELGEIPKGWCAGTINDLCMLNANSWSKKNEPDEVWYVDLANTKNGIIEEIQYYKWKDSPSRARRILKPGDTIVGTVRPGNRSFALIGKGDKQLTASTGFAVLTPKESGYLEYIYIAATSDSNVDRLAHLADGGAYPAVRPDVVTQLEVVIPSEEVLEKFSDITRPMFSHRENHFEQNAVLADCRDSLLPKLLSGKIDIEEERKIREIA